MAFLRVVTHVAAPVEGVWRLLLDWERSVEWMVDETSCEVAGPRDRAGMRIRSTTTVAGVPIVDDMIVRRLEPERLVEVEHVGWPIRGIAWFELSPAGDGTRFEWAEELDPPLGPLGEVGAAVLRRPLERMLRRSVANLKRLAESERAGGEEAS